MSSEKKTVFIEHCGCAFENGRADRQVLACEDHIYAGSLATPSVIRNTPDLLEEPFWRSRLEPEIRAGIVEKLEVRRQVVARVLGTTYDLDLDMSAVLRGKISGLSDAIAVARGTG